MLRRDHIITTLATALLALVLVSPTAYAQCGGLCAYEIGSPQMGHAYAGAGATAEDAATAFLNPAGMTRLKDNEVLLGTVGLFVDQEFNLNADKSVTVPSGQTNGGGNIGGFIPIGSAYAVMPITDKLRFGFSFNGFYGASLNYEDDWVGRTSVNDIDFFSINLEPALAYRVTDWLSVGAGIHFIYLQFSMDFKANSAPDAPTVKIDEADDWAFAATLGVLLEPRQGTRIGIVYRSEVDVSLSGDLENPTPMQFNFDQEFDLAQGVNVSLFQQLSPKWAVLADAGWSDWSTFSGQLLRAGPATMEIDRNWKDTWRIGVGAQYQVLPSLQLRGGFSYDSSPVSASDRLPDLPIGEQYRFAAGIRTELSEFLTSSLSYTYIWFGGGDVDQVALPSTGDVVLDGNYDPNGIHAIGLTFSGRW